jgi:hypothetical protein
MKLPYLWLILILELLLALKQTHNKKHRQAYDMCVVNYLFHC